MTGSCKESLWKTSLPRSSVLYACVFINTVFIAVMILRHDVRDILTVGIKQQRVDYTRIPGNTEMHSTSKKVKSEKHIIILAGKRTGSSFLGEILNQNTKVMYMFEPLFHFTEKVLKGDMNPDIFDAESVELVDSIFKCDFNNSRFMTRLHPLFCSTSNALSKSALCGKHKVPTDDIVVENFTNVCRTYLYKALKTIRIYDIELLRSLAVDPALNLKIIHLVRDPRGIMNSRENLNSKNLDFERKDVEWDEVTDLCKDIKKNLNIVSTSASWLKGRYMRIRYEDVAKHPHSKAEDIYDFIGLEMPTEVKQWISENTNQTKGNQFSRSRNSSVVATKWRNEMPFSDILSIQKKCSISMALLGYKEVKSPTDLNEETNVLGPLPDYLS
ncbi:carbohydrate sulfotransferase 1-like [Saccoglossus kowalevskii]|uniref:Carbohydrate sulfotransferase 1-like n=1 Tax=Saccoglossus kowalevskii TaxID=10224 RepID=A0ABM0H1D2_SACKO|nr:PREDICTED: carbohydrate sulfotransferase 1-like [Saccoglossus kowalevskii]